MVPLACAACCGELIDFLRLARTVAPTSANAPCALRALSTKAWIGETGLELDLSYSAPRSKSGPAPPA